MLEDYLISKGAIAKTSSHKWVLKFNSMSVEPDLVYQELTSNVRRDITRRVTYDDVNSHIIKENNHVIKTFFQKDGTTGVTLETQEAVNFMEELIRFYLDLKKPYVEWYS